MAGQSAVQNFSLPSRTAGRRPFSPSVDGGDGHDERADATALDRYLDHHPDHHLDHLDRVRSPTPTALQLFQFSDDTTSLRTSAAPAMRHSRVLPRPMSTSSSAPALTTAGGAAAATELTVSPIPSSPSPAILPSTVYRRDAVDVDKHQNRAEPIQAPRSPAMSVWPSPLAVAAVDPPENREDEKGGKREKQESRNGMGDKAQENRDAENGDDNDNPPSLNRSISVRWGPRLRHIPLSEVQAANDAARRVAALRREQRVFWGLVAVALVGVLSCTAAVTLAAAQAAMQSGLEQLGPDQGGGGPAWDPRTLGWLVASLVVCAAAAVGLVVATSARCRRRRCGGGSSLSRARQPWFGERASSPRPERKNGGGGGDCGGGSRCSHRFSALLSNRARHDESGTARDRAGWVEMGEMGQKEDHGAAGSVGRWWSLRRKCIDRKDPVPEEGCGMPLPAAVALCDEDRNWAKFSQDPVQLRRYVEALEARLAIVEGVQGARALADDPDRRRDNLGKHPVDRSGGGSGDSGTKHANEPLLSHANGYRDNINDGTLRQQKQQQQQPGLAITTTMVGLSNEPATPTTSRGVRPSTSLRTTATTTTVPVVGGLADNLGQYEESSNSPLLPLSSRPSPSSPSSPRRLRSSSGSPSLRREVRGIGGRSSTTNFNSPPVASDTQGSIIGQLYATYAEERSPWRE